VVEIANSAMVGRASMQDAVGTRPVSPDGDALAPLTAIAASPWRALAECAVEPNGYHLPDWELAVNASARGRTGVSALVRLERRLIDAGRHTAPDRAVAGDFVLARLQDSRCPLW
jgi:hypothetical protein